VSLALASYGARLWQIELTAGPIAQALNSPGSEAVNTEDG